MGLFILSFMNLNLGLHYVLWKSISIKYGYLNWRALSWKEKKRKKKTLITNEVVPFSLCHNHPFESITRFEWILNFQVHDRIIKKRKKKKNKALGWKPQKGQSRVEMKAYCQRPSEEMINIQHLQEVPEMSDLIWSLRSIKKSWFESLSHFFQIAFLKL